jgi:hypothetical protein
VIPCHGAFRAASSAPVRIATSWAFTIIPEDGQKSRSIIEKLGVKEGGRRARILFGKNIGGSAVWPLVATVSFWISDLPSSPSALEKIFLPPNILANPPVIVILQPLSRAKCDGGRACPRPAWRQMLLLAPRQLGFGPIDRLLPKQSRAQIGEFLASLVTNHRRTIFSADHPFAASGSNRARTCKWLSMTAKPQTLAAKHDQDHQQGRTDWRELVPADTIECWGVI